ANWFISNDLHASRYRRVTYGVGLESTRRQGLERASFQGDRRCRGRTRQAMWGASGGYGEGVGAGGIRGDVRWGGGSGGDRVCVMTMRAGNELGGQGEIRLGSGRLDVVGECGFAETRG